MDSWRRVMAKVRHLPDPDDLDQPEPLLSLEDYFEGNDQVGSIAANLNPEAEYAHPQYVYHILRKLRDRKDVHEVWVTISQVMEYDDPALAEEYRDWPYSNTVYVVSSASRKKIVKAVGKIHPDEVGEGLFDKRRPKPMAVPEGMSVYYVWWD